MSKYTDEQIEDAALHMQRAHPLWMKDASDMLRSLLSERQAAMQGQGGEVAPVAWQYRYKNDRMAWSRWIEWIPEEHQENPFPEMIGRWEVEYRQLYTNTLIKPPQPVRSVSDEDAKDAARYRWLLKTADNDCDYKSLEDLAWYALHNLSPEETTKAIDAAIAQEKRS